MSGNGHFGGSIKVGGTCLVDCGPHGLSTVSSLFCHVIAEHSHAFLNRLVVVSKLLSRGHSGLASSPLTLQKFYHLLVPDS